MFSLLKRITPQIGLWLMVLLLCLLFQLADWRDVLRFDRQLIDSGHWWLLITGNFVHLNTAHLAMNLMGLGLVAVFFSAHVSLWRWLMLLLLSSLAVTLGLYWFNPEVLRYVGLSGVLHGLFLAGAISEIRRYPLSGWVLSIVLIGKLIWEQINGAMPGSESMISGRVVVDSHFYGAISGFVLGVIWWIWDRMQKTQPENKID